MAVVSYRETVKRMLSTPRKKAYTFLGVTLIVVLVFTFGAIRPTVSTISRLYGEIKERQELGDKLQNKINTLSTLQKEYQEKEEDLEFLDVFFPENSDYSLLMASLEKISGQYGFEMSGLGITVMEKEVDKSGVTDMESVEVVIVATGSRSSIVPFVEHLENLPVVPDIESVSATAAGEEGSDEVRVNVRMTVYKQMSEAK